MDQCEDREEGVPPSKSSLCGEHDSQTKAQRKQQQRADSPEPSFVSMKSDRSMRPPIKFKGGQSADGRWNCSGGGQMLRAETLRPEVSTKPRRRASKRQEVRVADGSGTCCMSVETLGSRDFEELGSGEVRILAVLSS
eukprot:superscaffoldBa00006188_g21245